MAAAKRPQRVAAWAPPLARRDDAQRAAQLDQHLRQLVPAARQPFAERVVLRERSPHRRRQRLPLLEKPRLKLSALRFAQRSQLLAGHEQ